MSNNSYAGELSEQNTCIRCIVGTAAWATENLGGTWKDSAHKIGTDWKWSEENGWEPPPPPPDEL